MAATTPKQKVESIEERDGFISVSRTVLGKATDKVERIKVRPFVTNPATVSVKYGTTVPTEQYANVRVDVMFSCPCYKEEMLDVYYQLRDLADARLDEELKRLLGDKDGV